MLPHSGGAVAIWTGSELTGRVVEHELLARLPGWRAVVCDPRESLSRRVARGATLAVVCTDERPPAFLTGPVVLSGIRVTGGVPPALALLAARAALVSTRDPLSRDRLRDAGVAGDMNVLPHPGVLAHRVVDLESLPARRDVLRRLGVLPDGEYTVTSAAGLASGQDPVVVLPSDLDLDDQVAMLTGARAVITTDEDVEALHSAEKPQPDQESALDAHFDRIAGLAERALAETGPDPSWAADVLAAENTVIRAAWHRQRQLMLVQRQRLTEPNIRLLLDRRDALAELDRVRTENAELSARLADRENELREWRNTRLVRWTRPLRSVYARLRTR